MKVLVACEESQAVTIAFRELGFEAYSCDLIPESGGHPEWHIQGDALKEAYGGKYTLMIAHPPCTYLTVSGNKWMKPEYRDRFPNRPQQREDALKFFLDLYNAPIPHVAVENPIGVISSRFRKPDQVVQPWMFGHGETKATCFWLRGLPPLKPTKIVEGREQRLHLLPPSKDRAKLRSKTYSGIAEAMAQQWGGYIRQ